MSKIAVLSDIHANGEAFSVVLDKCHSIGVEKYVSLGDIIGYNADPAACVQAAKELFFVAMVRGNHDDYLKNYGQLNESGFNPVARAAIQWTRTQLSEEDINWVANAPYRAQLPGMTLVHATLDTPENWGYIFDAHHALDNFAYQFTQLCFCGHSHVPVAFCRGPVATNGRVVEMIAKWNNNVNRPDADEDFSIADALTVEYLPGHKYLFNIGSIGQPRNGDPRASFAVIDTAAHTVTRYRLPYDIAAMQQRNLDAGLPERLATRLATGK
ncbi:MAG: metallophosphoesterase family protein [Lentisphaeria bacterium]|nr:metallophosphoesterase family protein [Lentisphaeria bacterium]